MNHTHKHAVSLFLFALLLSSTGCLSLSRGEKATLTELKYHGVKSDEVSVKSPAAGAALNILPGFGNFYLATGEGDSSMWLYGFLNLLTWPVSVIWGIPEGAVDADIINARATAEYYMFDPRGKKEYARLISGDNPLSPAN